jgi:hypothetical protein
MSSQNTDLLLGLIQHQFSPGLEQQVVLMNAAVVHALVVLATEDRSNKSLDQLLAGLGARDLAGFWFDDDHWHPFATRRATRHICFGDSDQR